MLGENISHGQQGKEASRQQEKQEDLSLAKACPQIAVVYAESMLACLLTKWLSLASDQQWQRRGESFDVYPGPGTIIAGSDLCDTLGWLAHEWSHFGNIPGHSPGFLHTDTHTQVHKCSFLSSNLIFCCHIYNMFLKRHFHEGCNQHPCNDWSIVQFLDQTVNYKKNMQKPKRIKKLNRIWQDGMK